MGDPLIYLKPRVGKQQNSTHQCPVAGDSVPKETGHLPTPKSRILVSPVTVHTHIPPKNGRIHDVEHHATGEASDSRTRIMGHQSPLPKLPQTNVRSVRSEKDGNDAHSRGPRRSYVKGPAFKRSRSYPVQWSPCRFPFL